MRTDIEPVWGMLPLPSIVKQKVCEAIFPPLLIGHATWEHRRCLKPHRLLIYSTTASAVYRLELIGKACECHPATMLGCKPESFHLGSNY